MQTVQEFVIRPDAAKGVLEPSPRNVNSHAAIKQQDQTLFKINPEDWNNVPKIVYDATCMIIVRTDQNNNLLNKRNLEFTRELQNLKAVLDQME